MSLTGMIGATASHEAVHVTNQKNINQRYSNRYMGTKYDVEKVPNQALFRYTRQYIELYK